MTDACPRCAKVGRLYATEHGNRCARCVHLIMLDADNLARRKAARRKTRQTTRT